MTAKPPRRRKTDHEVPASPLPAARIVAAVPRGPITIYEVRALHLLIPKPADLVQYVVAKYDADASARRAAKSALQRYAGECGGPVRAAMLSALAKVEPREPGPARRETLTVTREGRVAVNVRGLAAPKGRVRVEHRTLDGEAAIILFKARRASDVT